jgi:hypothetical protein
VKSYDSFGHNTAEAKDSLRPGPAFWDRDPRSSGMP